MNDPQLWLHDEQTTIILGDGDDIVAVKEEMKDGEYVVSMEEEAPNVFRIQTQRDDGFEWVYTGCRVRRSDFDYDITLGDTVDRITQNWMAQIPCVSTGSMP